MTKSPYDKLNGTATTNHLFQDFTVQGHEVEFLCLQKRNNYHSCVNCGGLYNLDSKNVANQKPSLFNYATFFLSLLYNSS